MAVTRYTHQIFSNTSANWITRDNHLLEWWQHCKYCMYTLQWDHKKYRAPICNVFNYMIWIFFFKSKFAFGLPIIHPNRFEMHLETLFECLNQSTNISKSTNMMTSSNGNIFRVTGHLCGEFHRSPVNFPHKGQWRGALMFSLICNWIKLE